MNTPDFSVILTAYKRDYFEEQLRSVYNQSWQPSSVFIWQNGDAVDIKKYKVKYPTISLVHAEENYGFFGRWAFALLMTTDYVVILDDDTVPQERWFEYAINKCADTNCIIGGNGRYAKPLKEQVAVGDYGICEKDTYVDFVGHCWVFRRAWLNNMWRVQPYTFENGEDIHFCATCQIFQGIRSLVPKQEGLFASDTIKGRNRHSDAHASFTKKGHSELRNRICEFFLDLGWKTATRRERINALPATQRRVAVVDWLRIFSKKTANEQSPIGKRPKMA